MEIKEIIGKGNELLWFIKGWYAYQDHYGCANQNRSEAEGYITEKHILALEEGLQLLKNSKIFK